MISLPCINAHIFFNLFWCPGNLYWFFFLRMFSSFMFWINCMPFVFIGDVLTPHSTTADGLSAHCLLKQCLLCEMCAGWLRAVVQHSWLLPCCWWASLSSAAMLYVLLWSQANRPGVYAHVCLFLCVYVEHMTLGVKLPFSSEWTASSGLLHGFYHERLFSWTVMALDSSNCSSTCSGLQKPVMVSVSQNWPLPFTLALKCWLPTYSLSFESCSSLALSPMNSLQHV